MEGPAPAPSRPAGGLWSESDDRTTDRSPRSDQPDRSLPCISTGLGVQPTGTGKSGEELEGVRRIRGGGGGRRTYVVLRRVKMDTCPLKFRQLAKDDASRCDWCSLRSATWKIWRGRWGQAPRLERVCRKCATAYAARVAMHEADRQRRETADAHMGRGPQVVTGQSGRNVTAEVDDPSPVQTQAATGSISRVGNAGDGLLETDHREGPAGTKPSSRLATNSGGMVTA